MYYCVYIYLIMPPPLLFFIYRDILHDTEMAAYWDRYSAINITHFFPLPHPPPTLMHIHRMLTSSITGKLFRLGVQLSPWSKYVQVRHYYCTLLCTLLTIYTSVYSIYYIHTCIFVYTTIYVTLKTYIYITVYSFVHYCVLYYIL